MHPLERHYVGGIDEALTSFGMNKEALSPEEKAKMLAAYRARPKGMAAVTGAAGPAAGLGHAPGSVTPGAAPPVGGPGMDPRFAGRGISLETPPVVAEKNRAMRGMSLYGKQLPAEGGPVALHPGMNVVGHLMLPWPE
jgi:hypothetical protein